MGHDGYIFNEMPFRRSHFANRQSNQSCLSRIISPAGCYAILKTIAPAGRANSHPWLTALCAPSMARRPTSTITFKTD